MVLSDFIEIERLFPILSGARTPTPQITGSPGLFEILKTMS